MDVSLFEDFFSATIIRKDTKSYTAEQLKGMIVAMIEHLLSLKQNNWEEYAFLFAKYGENAIRRISFYNGKMQDAGTSEDINLAKKYLSAHNEFIKSLKALDRNMYERRLRGAIQKGKSTRNALAKKQQESTSPVSVNTPFFQNVSPTIVQLSHAYNYLVEHEWIEDNLVEEEFLYLFGGKGEASNKRIRWNKAKKYLALFIAAVSDDDNKWSTASKIFESRDRRTGTYVPVTNNLRINYREATHIKNEDKLAENKKLIEDIFA